MEEVLKRLHRWFQGKKASPEMLQIYPTNQCNLKCIFCVQRLGIYNSSEELSKERWLEVVKEVCRMGTRKFLISGGGEPLCVPEITLSIMAIIKSYHGSGRLITNGTLWSVGSIKEVIRMGWDTIVFSVDGATPETHNYLRDADCWGEIIKNIQLFNKYKRTQSPHLEITCVLNRHNYQEIPSLIKLAHKLRIESVNVEPVCVNNPTAKKIKLSKRERKIFFERILPSAEKIANSLGVRNNFLYLKKAEFLEEAGKLKRRILSKLRKKGDFLHLACYEPWLWPKIEANGEVWPCSSVQLKTSIKNHSFKEIWYGSEFNEFRGKILQADLPSECNNCVLTHLPLNEEIRENLKKRFYYEA